MANFEHSADALNVSAVKHILLVHRRSRFKYSRTHSVDGSIFRCLGEIFVMARILSIGLRTWVAMANDIFCCVAGSERLRIATSSTHGSRRCGPDIRCTSGAFRWCIV